MVMRDTQLSLSTESSRSVYNATLSRKPAREAISGSPSRKPMILERSSCTFSIRPRLSISFFSSSTLMYWLFSQTASYKSGSSSVSSCSRSSCIIAVKLFSLPATDLRVGYSSARHMTSQRLFPSLTASWAALSTVVPPIPRVGTLMIRLSRRSSMGLLMTHRYASMSLTSARSKNFMPPYTR